MSAESYYLPRRPADEVDEIDDSLPSSSTSDSDADSDTDSQADLEAQAEWERSIKQLESLGMLVLVPFLGKWMGRQFAYWGECVGAGWAAESPWWVWRICGWIR
jgi:hypothetical protein